MTSNVELLPLYAELQGHPKLEIVKHYARANVEHHTAEKDAEIEALRAEVATWEGLHASEVQVRQRWQARAERLAEALRGMLSSADDLMAYIHDEDEIGYRPCCGVLSYKPHEDGCAVTKAQSALRDHDQEVGDD